MRMKNKNLELPKRALTPIEAEQIYGVPVGSLANWRHQGKGPKYYRVSRKIYYLVSDFDRWFKRNPVLTSDSLPEGSES